MISAKIIADSKNQHGHRITSFLLVFPRIVLAEFNTHRAVSRNSASSRAIPFEKMLKKLESTPFVPMAFQKDHSGMQGTEYFEGIERTQLERDWISARDNAIFIAKKMSDQGCTKQLVNRLLEPFMMHTVIATATDWENFFALRAHDAAEIHIADLAHKMLREYNTSQPKVLEPGEWHIPFGDKIDQRRLHKVVNTLSAETTDLRLQFGDSSFTTAKVKIATARCARVSYENYEGTDDYEKDVKLYDRLSSMGHWSPFEHCARAPYDSEDKEDRSGNIKGFIQLRKTFRNENQLDPRVVKK